jgi:type IV pilus assembly protein PilO
VAALPPPAADGKKEALKGDQLEPAHQSPLEAAGLKAQKVLLTAKGPYPNVLAFLRATEKLTVLVSQSNLSLAAVELPKAAPQPVAKDGGNRVGAAVAPGASPVAAKTELKLMFTYYQSTDSMMPASVPSKN